MVNRVQLNNVDHHALRVLVANSGSDADRVNQLLLVPTEYEVAQREYPILFRKDAHGAFQSVALLGFERHENLFLGEAGWEARYVPAVLRRGPFFIGPGEKLEGEPHRAPAIFVDLDDPRINASDGEPLYLRHGGNSPYLEQVGEALRTVHEGLAISPHMFALLAELELMRPIKIDVELGDGAHYELSDFFTVDEERFAGLDGQALDRLHRAGYLAAVLFVRSSLANIERLVELKKDKLAAGR